MLDQEFDLLLQTRRNLRAITENLDDRRLLEIPEGLNNNILWNLGHVWVTQQLLCYRFSGLEMDASEELVAMLRKGSSPRDWSDPPDRATIEERLIASADKMRDDFKRGIFKEYKPYATSYGVTLRSVEQAIAFNTMHEALHMGVIMTQKHLLSA